MNQSDVTRSQSIRRKDAAAASYRPSESRPRLACSPAGPATGPAKANCLPDRPAAHRFSVLGAHSSKARSNIRREEVGVRSRLSASFLGSTENSSCHRWLRLGNFAINAGRSCPLGETLAASARKSVMRKQSAIAYTQALVRIPFALLRPCPMRNEEQDKERNGKNNEPSPLFDQRL